MADTTTSQLSATDTADSNVKLRSLYDSIRAEVRSNPKAGVKSAQQGVMTAKQQNAIEWQARFYTLLAEAYFHIENYHNALRYYEKARAIFQQGQEIDVRFVDSAVAIVHLELEQYDKSKSIYDELLRTVESGRLNNNHRFAELKVLVYTGFARWHSQMDEYIQAIQYSYNALDLCEHNALPARSKLLGLLGTGRISYMLGDREHSQKQYYQALTLSIETDDVLSKVSALFNLARIARDAQDFSTGLGYQRQAWHEAQEKLGLTRIASCHTVAGSIYIQMNRTDLAKEELNKALSLFDSIGLKNLWRGEALFGSAIVSFREGEFEKALKQMLEMLGYVQQNKHVLKAAFCHNWLAEVYQKIGDHENALKHFQLQTRLENQVRGKQQQRMVAQRQLENKLQALEQKLEQSRQELHSLKQKIAQEHDSAAAAQTSVEQGSSLQPELDGLQQHFKATLIRQFPKLTPTELKVCCLLRTGLISKEIAEVLSITPASVDVYRHRIRKKMELIPEVNLVSYLNSI